MKNIKILDCTLRDGGFVNNWNFGKKIIESIFSFLQESKVDFVEVGYLYGKQNYNENYTRFPNTQAINQTFKNLVHNNNLVAIIDYGDCPIENISDASASLVQNIRVTFKMNNIPEAADFCKKLKAKGYNVFMQPVSVTTYSDIEMLNLIQMVNEISPFAFSIVDTYGLLDMHNIARLFNLIDHNLSPQIGLGYHAHNNFQLGLANAITLLNQTSSRMLIIDSSAYGMGKSAGNLCTELLMTYLNQYYHKKYNINAIIDLIHTNILNIYQENAWGYQYDYFLCAYCKCHPKYLFFLKENNVSQANDIIGILSSIPDDKKLSFNQELIEKLIEKYRDNHDV